MRKLIVLESINGFGKTTIINKLISHYPDAIITSHPGSTDIGKELRKLLKFGNFNICGEQELALFAADAIGFYKEYIEDKDDNKLVICDRLNLIGAVTYQRAKGVNLSVIDSMYNMLVHSGWTKKIDKLLIFNAPYEIIQSRIKKPTLVDQDKVQGDKKDRFESAGDEYMKLVYKYYQCILYDNNIRSLLKRFVKPDNIYQINAAKTIDEVFVDVKNVIDQN
jgi:thymidylate kinase